jgi:predicted component of type VI protein secretion system
MRKKIAIIFLFIFFVLTLFSNILREPERLQIESSWEKLNAVKTLENIQIKIMNIPKSSK